VSLVGELSGFRSCQGRRDDEPDDEVAQSQDGARPAEIVFAQVADPALTSAVLYIEDGRTVSRDNTVGYQRLPAQLPPFRFRPHYVNATAQIAPISRCNIGSASRTSAIGALDQRRQSHRAQLLEGGRTNRSDGRAGICGFMDSRPPPNERGCP
jgi:hypothetical protein